MKQRRATITDGAGLGQVEFVLLARIRVEAIAFLLVGSAAAGTITVYAGEADPLNVVDAAGPVFGGRFIYPHLQEPTIEADETLTIEATGADPDVPFVCSVQHRAEP